MGYQVGEWIITDQGETGYVEQVSMDMVSMRVTLDIDGNPARVKDKQGRLLKVPNSWPLKAISRYVWNINPMPIEKYYNSDVVDLALATNDHEWLKELSQLRGEKLK